MKETAEDILERHIKGWTPEQRFWKKEILKFAREIADKAWEAGYRKRKDEQAAYIPSVEPSKEDFMKETFTMEV